MQLIPGGRLGPYEIVGAIGSGGMGQVYRARDTRLQRSVAIKVLPAEYGGDPERIHRLEQEARATASLNHPNIMAVYDVGVHDAAPYIVSELLEGETLRDALANGPLPTRRAIEYAVEIARGLGAAHERSVLHRDLKPENIFVTNDRRVKILDFGLAKLLQPPGDCATATIGGPSTEPGVVMGTAGYMSPEQVRGQSVDHRSDIFAFGAVMYEMLSGQRAFRGASPVETLNAILTADPPELAISGAQIAPALERIVRRCLEKNPADRFQSARDLAFAIESAAAASGAAPALPASARRDSRRWQRYGWMTAGVMAAAFLTAVSTAILLWRARAPAASTIRFSATLPESAGFYMDVETHNLSIAPDGHRLAFVAMSDGQRRVWVRALDAVAAQALPGTEGAYSPFWSPDSRYIAFFAGGRLKRVDPSGKSLHTIAELSRVIDTVGTWGRDGTILFVQQFGGQWGIYRVAAAGGTPTTVEAGQTALFSTWVHFLPDGRHYLVYRLNEHEPSRSGVYVASIDSTEKTLLAATPPTRMEYAGGHLIYAREGSLLAHRFDEKKLKIAGEPVTIVGTLPYFDKTGWSEFSVSQTGVLAYLTRFPMTRLTWVDRTGREIAAITGPGLYGAARLSPDGHKVALSTYDSRGGSGDIWVHDPARGTAMRFASGPADDHEPVWSPDGRQLASFSCCEDKSTLYIKDLRATGKGRTPLSPGFQAPVDWSPDGRFILFTNNEPTTASDLWVLPLDQGRKPYPLTRTPFDETAARFSPDGRWVAYVSTETGRSEVYVLRFDRPEEKWLISASGGSDPAWRHDMKELIFLAADGSLMAVAVKTGATFDYGPPARLFQGAPAVSDLYAVSADGQRFLVNSSAAGPLTAPFTVVLNWLGELNR